MTCSSWSQAGRSGQRWAARVRRWPMCIGSSSRAQTVPGAGRARPGAPRAVLTLSHPARHVQVTRGRSQPSPVRYGRPLTGAHRRDVQNPLRAYIPTVSPAKNSLVYFISIAYIDRPLLRGHGQEAKIGEAGGHRITRNGAALESFLLTCATTELSLIAMWRLIGATPRGQPWTPAVTLPHGRDELSARRMAVLWTFREPSLGRHVPHELLRNAVLNLTLIIPATAC